MRRAGRAFGSGRRQEEQPAVRAPRRVAPSACSAASLRRPGAWRRGVCDTGSKTLAPFPPRPWKNPAGGCTSRCARRRAARALPACGCTRTTATSARTRLTRWASCVGGAACICVCLAGRGLCSVWLGAGPVLLRAVDRCVRWHRGRRARAACRASALEASACLPRCKAATPTATCPCLTTPPPPPPPRVPSCSQQRLGMSSHYSVFEDMFVGY